MKLRSFCGPFTPANSAMLEVNSRVTSMTAALSGPYDSTLKLAMMLPTRSASTANAMLVFGSAVTSCSFSRSRTRLPARSHTAFRLACEQLPAATRRITSISAPSAESGISKKRRSPMRCVLKSPREVRASDVITRA